VSLAASMAFSLEPLVTPKPGNVHRLGDVKDLKLEYFTMASPLLLPLFRRASKVGIEFLKYNIISKGIIGKIVYDCSLKIKRWFRTNIGLGAVLTLTVQSIASSMSLLEDPAFSLKTLSRNVGRVIRTTTVEDTTWYYKSIKLFTPGYLGRLCYLGYPDVNSPFYNTILLRNNISLHKLLQILSLDLVSKNLASNLECTIKYFTFFNRVYCEFKDWNYALVVTYLKILSENIDYLVFRRHGIETAKLVMLQSKKLLDEILNVENWRSKVLRFDLKLRREGINPGSTADIITSVIMVALMKGIKP